MSQSGEVQPKAGGKSRTPKPASAMVGTVIGGRYKIERIIGEGGMGAVYQAEHTLMHKKLAVKVLHSEMSHLPEVVARFEREAMAAAHIEHPNVAAATDFGKLDDGSFFLVLEYVEGGSLRDVISEGRLPVWRAVHIARQIASALGRAHGLGIVHRDLKPENVMLVQREGDPNFVKVLDFGIAKVPVGDIAPESSHDGKALTQLGMVYGTPEYMAPEQALGQEVDARADLYSLGIILFEMLTGARPFSDPSKVKLLGMHITAPVPAIAERAPDAGVPPELEAIVRRSLAKESKERWHDARELVEAIDATAGISASSSGTYVMATASGRFLPQPSQPRLPSQASLPDASAPSLPDASAPSPPGVLPVTARQTSRTRALWNEARKQASPRVLAITGGALGVLLLMVVLSVALSTGHHDGPTKGLLGGSTTGTPTSTSKAPPDPHVDEQVRAAEAALAAGDRDKALAILEPLERDAPHRADVHHDLSLVRAAQGDTRGELEEALEWLAADTSAQPDTSLVQDTRKAAASKATADAAFALLESGKLGAAGSDELYELAYGKHHPAWTAARARKALSGQQVREQASPALKVALDLREAKTCEQKHALLPEAARVGDARALGELLPLTSRRGCGFANARDCHPCLRKDGQLGTAIKTIRARDKK